jgi:hypothetical protein
MGKTIRGVEIFSAGTWNDDKYTTDDLHEMVRAFNENAMGARPHLKLGHDPEQIFAEALLGKKPTDGAPAAGWIERLYVRGEKLVADFCDIPDKLFAMINEKFYRKVSSEIFHNIQIGEKKYSKMLAAVALLGADNPGVMNLSDIMSQYRQGRSLTPRHGVFRVNGVEFKSSNFSINEIEFKSNSTTKSTFEGDDVMKTEAEIRAEVRAEIEKENAAKEAAALKEFKAQATREKEEADAAKAAVEKENAELKEFKAAAEKEKAALLAEKETARLEAFTTSLVADRLCTPAMKPLVAALLGPEKKEYSVKTKDKETKLSKEELLKETLKLFKAASEVNFDESSSTGDEGKKDRETELDTRAKAYATKHNVSYGQALKAVIAEKQ